MISSNPSSALTSENSGGDAGEKRARGEERRTERKRRKSKGEGVDIKRKTFCLTQREKQMGKGEEELGWGGGRLRVEEADRTIEEV